MEQVETKVDVVASRSVGRNEASTDTSEHPVDVLAVMDALIHYATMQSGGVGRDYHEQARAAVEGLIEVAKVMLPANLCLTNPNVPDDTKLPLTATMGELRAIAAALVRVGALK